MRGEAVAFIGQGSIEYAAEISGITNKKPSVSAAYGKPRAAVFKFTGGET